MKVLSTTLFWTLNERGEIIDVFRDESGYWTRNRFTREKTGPLITRSLARDRLLEQSAIDIVEYGGFNAGDVIEYRMRHKLPDPHRKEG